MAEKKRGGKLFTSEYQPDYEKRTAKRREQAAQRKAFKEIFEALLDNNYTDDKGTKLSGKQMLAMKVFKTAITEGNLEAFKINRETIGEKPVEKVVTTQVTAEKIAEIEDMINGNVQ